MLEISILNYIHDSTLKANLEEALKTYTEDDQETAGLDAIDILIGSKQFINDTLSEFQTKLHDDS